MQTQNRYLNFINNPSLLAVNILFALSFENDAHRTRYKRIFRATVETEDYNVMTDEKKQPLKNDGRTYDNIRNIATGQGDENNRLTSGLCFL